MAADFNPIKNLFKGGAEGIVKGLTDGAANIISKVKADPTKVAEYEKELEELKTNANLEALRIANEAEKIQLEREEAYLKDNQSARDSNARIQESDKASWLAKNVGYILDLFTATLWGTITIILFLRIFKVAAQDVDMVSLLALHGTVTAVFMNSITFHRGSSKGSEDKSKELRELRNK